MGVKADRAMDLVCDKLEFLCDGSGVVEDGSFQDLPTAGISKCIDHSILSFAILVYSTG